MYDPRPRGSDALPLRDSDDEDDGARPEPRRADHVGSDVIVVTAHRVSESDPPEPEVQIRGSDGRTTRVPVPERFVDDESLTLALTELFGWLAVDPRASDASRRDGLGALQELAPSADTPIHVPLVRPGTSVGGLSSTRWMIGLDPEWGLYPGIALGGWAREEDVPDYLPLGGVEMPPATPRIGDTDAWPDTLDDWLVDLDARLRLDPNLTAPDFRAVYVGRRFGTDEAQDPAMEEALRIREVPGALPPPEPLPPARPPTAGGAGAPDPGDLPEVRVDNRVAIVDRPDRDSLLVPFAGTPREVRELWNQRLGEAASRGGCASALWLWLVSGVVALGALVLVVVLVLGPWSSDDGDGGDDGSAAATEDTGDADASDDAGTARVVDVERYAGWVCDTLAEEVRDVSDEFAAALAAAQGAQPQTAEEADDLFLGIEQGANDLAGGLTAAAADLADGPVPDVPGGEQANADAVETYRAAAATLRELAEVVAAYDPATADATDAQILAEEMNDRLAGLGALGTEFAGAPEVQAAIDAEPACAGAPTGG
jgi:hypothetical protein